MEKIFFIRGLVGAVPYWASDYNLIDAVNRYKRLTGKYPTNEHSIVMFEGKEVDEVSVNDLGDIQYPKTLTKTVIQ